MGRRRWTGDERGAVTVVVALTAAALMGLLALGIDLGALFNARSEAQRAADAAALAGASAFLEFDNVAAVGEAQRRALEYAGANEIRNASIDPGDVDVWVDPASQTVRAKVRRDSVATWFARLFGVESVDIGAEATAWAGEAGAASCLKPFAIPDMWEETTDDTNGNRLWDEGEQWRWDPSRGDRYDRFSGGSGGANETGYGSSWRDGQVDASGRRYDGDYGRRITVKVTRPQNTFMPSFFFPWVLPADPNQSACGSGPGGGNGGGIGGPGGGGSGGGVGGDDSGGGPGQDSPGWLTWFEKRGDLGVGGGSGGGDGSGGGNGGGSGGGNGGGAGGGNGGGGARGAAAYRRNICSCNNSVIDLDTEYLIEPGNMVGPTHQGVSALIAQDPGAYWDEMSNEVVSQYGMDSPRVITVALFDPSEITRPGRQYIRFNNFARVFIEEQASPQDPVTGRFLYYVRGIGGAGRPGATKGSLVRTLQLIR